MEYIIGATGARGSGKSTLLSLLGLGALLDKIDVFCNMDIGGEFAEGDLRSQPLEAALLFEFGDRAQGAFVGIDEMQFYADRRESTTNKNKLLNWVGIQIRKRQVSIAYTILFFNWLDSRWQQNTDIMVQCKDLFFTPWGRENNLKRGEELNFKFWDMTGVMTGNMARFTGKPYKNINVYAKALWSYFSSYSVVGMDEAFRRYDIVRETYAVGNRGMMGDAIEPQPIDTQGITGRVPRHHAKHYISTVVDQLRAENIPNINAADMRALIGQAGLQDSPQRIGRLLAELGVKPVANSTRGKYYEL